MQVQAIVYQCGESVRVDTRVASVVDDTVVYRSANMELRFNPEKGPQIADVSKLCKSKFDTCTIRTLGAYNAKHDGRNLTILYIVECGINTNVNAGTPEKKSK